MEAHEKKELTSASFMAFDGAANWRIPAKTTAKSHELQAGGGPANVKVMKGAFLSLLQAAPS